MAVRKKIAIVGCGPAALMLAATLDKTLFEVEIFEKNHAPSRKFLVAGDGGLNLTHSEEVRTLLSRYKPAGFLDNAILSFSNTDLCKWLDNLGVPTFTGSSKRIYPQKGIKPIAVLEAILNFIFENEVKLYTKHKWVGWENNLLLFENKEGSVTVGADVVVFALGGASWSKTGSDGKWAYLFEEKKISVIPFQPSNCALKVEWPEQLVSRVAGKWIKNLSVRAENETRTGEIIISAFGMEGTPVYALNYILREELEAAGQAFVYLDFKPSLTATEIKELLLKSAGTLTEKLRNKLRLTEVHILLLKTFLNKDEFTDCKILAEKIKNFQVKVTGFADLEEAISTKGGISLAEISENFELKKLQGHYAIGEMLDWDAPTGGYLLQACFSQGFFLATKLNEHGQTAEIW